ncbi:MAG TPA: hypothetical protein VFA68_16210 [Terriglobales bacterium]|nr:hypothetical protein [Terriglobales bacterium]
MSARTGRERRRKSGSWWSGLFTWSEGEVSFNAQEPPASCDHLPRPLSVEDVLRRGTMARDRDLIEGQAED